MKNLLELKASLGRIHQDGQEYEIFAQGSATYDHPGKILTIALACFLQEQSAVLRKILHPSWMPRQQTDREQVEENEATDLGREIFRPMV